MVDVVNKPVSSSHVGVREVGGRRQRGEVRRLARLLHLVRVATLLLQVGVVPQQLICTWGKTITVLLWKQ
jgi:hypothetical protein